VYRVRHCMRAWKAPRHAVAIPYRETRELNDDGQPIDPNYASRALPQRRGGSRHPHIPLHGLRPQPTPHRWIDAGVSISVVSKRLGHANANITSGV